MASFPTTTTFIPLDTLEAGGSADKSAAAPSLKVGMVSVLCLTAYSVGRLLFFMVREDEVRR